jgi:hypothetical protein
MLLNHKHFRRFLISALTFLLVLPMTAEAAWSTLRDVQSAERNILEIDGQRRAYWKIGEQELLEVEVTGPSQVRIFSRAPYRMSHKGKNYGFSVSVDGSERKLIRHDVSKSRSAFTTKSKKRRLSASRTDEVTIPPGTHTLRIVLEDGISKSLYFRLRNKFVHPMPKGGNIDKYPLTAGLTRDILVHESRSLYHVLPTEGELEVEVIGPTFLKVISRIDWNSTMSGNQKYMLKILEDGEFKTTWVLQGRHSSVAIYDEKKDSTPARGEVIYVQVPEGKHIYKVHFKDSGREVNLRFLIPRESLRN